jgi:predicted amidohydrolase YtcJ
MGAQLWLGAEIVTMDSERPRARSLLVRDGVVEYVGSEEQARARARAEGGDAELREARGLAIVPGFNDNHVHAVYMGDNALAVDLAGLDERQVVARLRDRFPSPGRGEIVRAFNWDYPSCPDPRKELLDEAFPRNAVILSQFSGHAQWLNSVALSSIGITRRGGDPRPGPGRPVPCVLRDPDGEPTGVVRDLGDTRLSRRRVLDLFYNPRLRDERLELAFRTFASLGVTSIQDNTWFYPELFSLKRRLREGSLTARMSCWSLGRRWSSTPAIRLGLALGLGDRDWIRPGPVKFFLDGTFSTRNACLSEPFEGERPGSCPDPAAPLGELESLARRGLQGAFHIIGDRGIAIFLDAYEKVLARHPGMVSLRMRIEHAQLVRAEDMSRLRELGVLVSAQPSAMATPVKDEALLGRKRALRAYPYRSLLDSGVQLSFGSDIPGETGCDPIRSIHMAVNREGPERISAEEALRCYTVGSAYAEFMEDRKGMLKEGMLADFAVLSQDLTKVPKERIGDTVVLETVVGGRTVYLRGR